MKRFTHTYDSIITIEKLLKAWQEFVRDKKDRKDVILFQAKLMNNIFDLHQDLKNKTYKHGGYFAFNISDPKPREIHKATVRDRLIHHLIYQELYTYFDPKFIHDSYSCRLNKGTHKAVKRFREFSRKVSKNNTQTCFVLKCDIRKFFANIDHEILKSILSRTVLDTDVLWLLGQVIDSFRENPRDPRGNAYGVTHMCDSVNVYRGLPLGNLTSQLLVNIYMNEFDQYVKRKLKVKYYIRYADDFVILQNDNTQLENLLPKISEFLEQNLKLQLHPDKVYIKTTASGVDFLGWVSFPYHRVLRTTTRNRMLKNLAHPPAGILNEASRQSYLGMLSHGDAYKLYLKIRYK